MRKQRKAMLAAVAGLMFMLTFTGLAAAAPAGPATPATPAQASAGWRQEAGGRAYYAYNGQRAVSTWVKSGDGKTARYLDENGFMATDRLVPFEDGISYVDETGAQAENSWIFLPNNGLWDEPVENVYYYFGSNGKAVRDRKQKIEGKTYFFDGEGRMLSGWHEDDGEYYYLGTEDEGYMHTGWQLLTPMDTDESGFMDQWYYFHKKNGKAYCGRRKIDGSYYYFDEDSAAMQEGWIEWEDQYAYYEPESGKMATGWVYCEGPEDGAMDWYYMDKDGVPFNYGGKDAGERGRAIDYKDVSIHKGYAARTVKGDTYLFDADGRMVTGMYYLWEINNTNGRALGGKRHRNGQSYIGGGYFFDNREGASLGKMLKGGRKTVTVDGTERYFCFDYRGRAYDGYIVDGYLYDLGGELMRAEDPDKYRIVDLSEEEEPFRIEGTDRLLEDCLLLVDRKGKVKKDGKVTYDGYRYTVKNYVVAETEEVD